MKKRTLLILAPALAIVVGVAVFRVRVLACIVILRFAAVTMSVIVPQNNH